MAPSNSWFAFQRTCTPRCSPGTYGAGSAEDSARLIMIRTVRNALLSPARLMRPPSLKTRDAEQVDSSRPSHFKSHSVYEGHQYRFLSEDCNLPPAMQTTTTTTFTYRGDTLEFNIRFKNVDYEALTEEVERRTAFTTAVKQGIAATISEAGVEIQPTEMEVALSKGALEFDSKAPEWVTGTYTTGYWDCCKPSCAWKDKGRVTTPIRACHKETGARIFDSEETSVCDGGDSATCADNTPFSIGENLSMGFAAAAIYGEHGLIGDDHCGQCFEIQFTEVGCFRMTKLRIAMKELKTHLQVASERGRNQKKRLLTKMILVLGGSLPRL